MKKYFLLLLAIACCSHAQHNAHTKKTIIISWNVFFKPNEKIIEQHVRSSLNIFRAIGLLFSGIPSKEEIKHQLFSLLQEICLVPLAIDAQQWQSPYAPWDVDYAYPPILNQFITSTSFEHEKIIYNTIVKHIRNHPTLGSTRKLILKSVADFLFQSKWMNKAMEPAPHMVNLVTQLQREGHKVIIISGTPGHAWDTFLAYAPQAKIIKQLFTEDTLYVSGHYNLLHTSPEMYSIIIDDHQLNPADCIVIAHNHHDLKYPHEIGMHTLVYNSKKHSFDMLYKNLMSLLNT